MSSLLKTHYLVGIFLLVIGFGLLQNGILVQAVPADSQSGLNNDYSSEVHTQLITSIPSFSLTPENMNQSIEQEIIPEFTPFLDITMVEVVLNQNFSKIFGTDLTITLNGKTQTQTYSEGSMEETMQLIFLLDDKSEIQFTSPLILKWDVNTNFDPDRFWPLNGESFHGIQVQYMKIITAPRAGVSLSGDVLSSAIFLPNELYSVKENSVFGLLSTEVQTYLLLPEGITEEYVLNITITANTIIDYEFILGENVFLKGELPKNASTAHIQLKVKKDIPENQILSLLTIRYVAQSLPSEGVIMNVQGEWGFDTSSSSLLPTSQYDILLFLSATLIPVVLVSRLFWKRTFHP